MARRKHRPLQHVAEEESLQLVRSLLPEEWVIHEYKPDYGIDNVVEIFRYVDGEREIAETLRIFLYSGKGYHLCGLGTISVYPRANVEKPDCEVGDSEPIDVEVVSYTLDTNELLTIQSMGSGVPVLLFLASLDTERLFYVCLNDLIDKVIIPDDPEYTDKRSKTLCIPVKNQVLNDYQHLVPLRFYAKRAKLYSAFIKFSYQANELSIVSRPQTYDQQFLRDMVLHFIAVLKCLDIWYDCEMWKIIEIYFDELCRMERMLQESSRDFSEILDQALVLWRRLAKLSHIYEELCREWFLPTCLALSDSYPGER
ncbi:MAG: DUF4365 domain-containing protein [Chloroflexota bacterium]|nr:DUF4365 domain-containing protein [Chloroflexota bacterium]